jgi:AbiV family abortive infection protein
VAGRKSAIHAYRDKLTPKQVAEGMNAAARCARRLCEDAEILLAAGRYPSACSLAILSIEESGKLSVLRELSFATNKARLNTAWRRYADHRQKNAQWIITELTAKGARTLDDLRSVFDPKSDHSDILNVIKQLGFYSDCYGPAHWSEPQEVIDESLTRAIVFTAKVLVPKHDTTDREIELWIEHVGQYWGQPRMYAGAIAFHEAMEKEGLARYSLDEIRAFYGIAG